MAAEDMAVKPLRVLRTEELKEIFSDATRDAAEKALKAGLSICGIINGRMALVHPDHTYTPI